MRFFATTMLFGAAMAALAAPAEDVDSYDTEDVTPVPIAAAVTPSGSGYKASNATTATSTTEVLTTTVVRMVTKTQCPETVTLCPAHSTIVYAVTETLTSTTTYCPESATKYPNATAPYQTKGNSPTTTKYSEALPTYTKAPVCSTVKTSPSVYSSVYYSTVVQTYTSTYTSNIVETLTTPCPAPTTYKPTGGLSPAPSNGTKHPVTAGAAQVGVSFAALVAGVAAVIFA